jgi:tetratricopeptide (TPR) repeat protein
MSETFGQLLCHFRIRAGLTVSELAEAVGASRKSIAAWERNRYVPRDRARLLDLAQTLHLVSAERDQLIATARRQRGALRDRADSPPPSVPASNPFPDPLPTMVLPHQLRPPVADFVGRAAQTKQLLRALRGASRQGVLIGAVLGMGGIGKTELAYHVAQGLGDTFPDAQIMLRLGGASPAPLTAVQALQTVIRAFLPQEQLPDDLLTLQARYRTLLHQHRVLILADDARDAAQVRPLLPPAGCALLVTSRTRFTLPGMTTIDLEHLSAEEATRLLQTICPRLSTAEAQAIAQVCGHLPLALRVSGGILRNDRALSVAAYLARLTDARQRLGQLRDPDDGQLDVAATLTLSYTQLDATAQQVFRQLGVMVGDFATELAVAVVEAPAGVMVEAVLRLLLRCILVMYDAERGRWRLHDLLRDLACSYLETCGEWDATSWRYAQAAVQISQAAEGQHHAGGGDALAAFALFDADRPHIDAARRWATAHAGMPQADALLVQDALAMHFISLLRYDAGQERLPQLQGALAAAQRLGNQQQIGRLLVYLARVYVDLGAPHQARHYAQQALPIVRILRDRRSERLALTCLAVSHALQGAFREAIPYFEQALAIAQEQGDSVASAGILANLGHAHVEVGMLEQALSYLDQAHISNCMHGTPHNECLILMSLGRVYVALRDAPRAIATLEHGLTRAQAVRSRSHEADLLSILGQARAANGDHAGALRGFEAALAMLHEVGDRWAEAECQWHCGLALAHQGEWEQALPLLRAAVAYKQEIGHIQAATHAALLVRLEAGATQADDSG